ncbi:MAG: hypothetical protein RIR49_237 [Actinomycetota bacterium]|jgi:hypothetical protein
MNRLATHPVSNSRHHGEVLSTRCPEPLSGTFVLMYGFYSHTSWR